MTVERSAIADKILVLGIDGMDPKLARRYVDEGYMPNLQKFLQRGSARKDLMMLGGQPTITPPMWTTLCTGAYPVTHGITDFMGQSGIDGTVYNLDSRRCKAEQLWNVFVEAGKRTLVWHWPGSSWPPTSDDPLLHVVDGTQPGFVNMGGGVVDAEKLLVASPKTTDVYYRRRSASDGKVPCVIEDLEAVEEGFNMFFDTQGDVSLNTKVQHVVMLTEADGEGSLSDSPFDVILSPLTDAKGWAEAPADAKEFVMLHGDGLIRRPCLVLKNEEGIYDHVAVYKSKKEIEPMTVLQKNVFTKDIVDESFKNGEHYLANRNMRILELTPEGDYLKMWISAGMNLDNDRVWHPKSLYKDVVENVGYSQPTSLLGAGDEQLIRECMMPNWTAGGQWQADVLNYFIEEDRYDVIFSHFHNVDLEGHMIVKFLRKGHKEISPERYQAIFRDVYVQTDEYIGRFLHLLDKGWTILIVSDHGQVCPEHEVQLLGDPSGINVTLMRELGFTEVLKDAEGNDLHEIDWSKTRAVACRANNIYLNLIGRTEHGIVDPADQYELEEEIMTALYGYRDPETGKRVISLALRNKDAVLLGYGGPECGDICVWCAEGYNRDHGDALSTFYGYAGTSVSPIFAAAGKGIKENFVTDRLIREVDVAPTIAVLGGVRMPAQCEGAPVYQIFDREI